MCQNRKLRCLVFVDLFVMVAATRALQQWHPNCWRAYYTEGDWLRGSPFLYAIQSFSENHNLIVKDENYQ